MKKNLLKKLLSICLATIMTIGILPVSTIQANVSNTQGEVYYGDVNDDNQVDSKDVTSLRRYLAGGWDVTINQEKADVNGDSKVDSRDVTMLRRYLAGGWGVEIPEAPASILTPDGEVIINSVNFPDENFRSYVEYLDNDNNGALSEEELSIETISVTHWGVQDLKGIEFFRGLKNLACEWCQLTSLDLGSNMDLRSLECAGNNISELNISNNTGLVYLDCGMNQLSELNISNNPSLEKVVCYSNNLTEINVSNAKNLKELDCAGNLLELLDVSENAALTELICYDNRLTELDLDNNPLLTSISCSDNQLSSLNVRNNPALTYISCEYNLIETLDVGQNTDLELLTCSYNRLKSIDISKNDKLTNLYCNGNQLEELNVDANTLLVYLWCSYNQLTSINVGNNTNLESFECNGNNLSAIDVSQNTKLKSFSCTNNDLSELSLSQNHDLEYLYCFTNNLTSLDMQENTCLKYLSCESNQLNSLNVSKNKRLMGLSCSYNKLTELDLTENIKLQNLHCNGNKITFLDLSMNPDMSPERLNADEEVEIIWNKESLEEILIDENTFPDDNFRNYILDYYDTDHNGVLSNEERISVTSLWVDSKGFSDLTGIEYFRKLNSLHCSENNLTALNISKNLELEDLKCNDNQIEELDISNNIELAYLDCHYNKLTSLDVKNNDLLTYLNCYRNEIKVLDISKNLNLKTLICAMNKISELDVTLNTKLEILDCSNNEISGLNVNNNTTLTELTCYDNNLSSLNVTYNTELTTLHCTENYITELDLSNNLKLYNLWVSWNELTEIDVRDKNELFSFTCDHNMLTELDLTNNYDLVHLDCSGNKLSSLDISNNTVLAYLDCRDNRITKLNLKENAELTSENVYADDKVILDWDGSLGDLPRVVTAYGFLPCYYGNPKTDRLALDNDYDAIFSVEFDFDDDERVIGFIATCDETGDVIEAEFKYDEYGNNTETIWNYSNGRKLIWEYNLNGVLVYEYDSQSFFTETKYDENGYVTEYVLINGSKTDYVRDEHGNVLCEIGFDDAGEPIYKIDKEYITINEGFYVLKERQYLYENSYTTVPIRYSDGQVTDCKVVEMNNYLLDYCYDTDGKCITIVCSDFGNDKDMTLTFEYEGNVNIRTDLKCSDGNEKWWEYNESGQVLRSYYTDENGSYEFEFYDNGNPYKEWVSYNEDSFYWASSIEREYYENGKMYKEYCVFKDGSSSVQTFDENGNSLTKIEYDSEGVTTRHWEYLYDEEGRLLKETAYDNEGDTVEETEYVVINGESLVSKEIGNGGVAYLVGYYYSEGDLLWNGVNTETLMEYSYNDNGKITEIICTRLDTNEVVNVKYEYENEDGHESKTEWTYVDGSTRTWTILSDGEGYLMGYIYADSYGNTAEYEMNAKGRIREKKETIVDLSHYKYSYIMIPWSISGRVGVILGFNGYLVEYEYEADTCHLLKTTVKDMGSDAYFYSYYEYDGDEMIKATFVYPDGHEEIHYPD